MLIVQSPSIRHALAASRWLWLVLVLAGLTAVLTVSQPFVVQRIIDAALTQQALTPHVLTYAVLAMSVPILQWLITSLASHTAWSATNALRHATATAIFAQPLEFFRSHGIGELSERIDADSGQLHGVFGEASARLVSTVILIISVGVTTWLIDPLVCILILLYLVIGIAIIAWGQRDNHHDWEAERVADAALYDTIEESFASVTDMRAVGAESRLHQRLTPRIATLLHTHRTARLRSQIAQLTSTAINAVGWLLAIGIGIWRYQSGTGSIGEAVALLGYVTLLTTPIEEIRGIVQEYQQARGVISRIDELMQPTPVINGTRALPSGPLSVRLEQVSYHYPSSPDWVIRDLSLTIPAGTHVAIIGRTGSGKTTLGRLVSRIERAQQGSILLNDIPIDAISESSLRHAVGVISQESDIFNATLRDNITCFTPGYSDDAISVALQACGLGDWLASLPDGLDTPIGDGERALSPGEQQLLAVARIAIKQPGIIVLDEASAHVDPANEQRITTALANLTSQRTTFTIAHRLNTVYAADLVIIMADGVVIESGAPQQLAATPGSHFATLLATNLTEVL
ncbi:MAG: ABC transporter ATP-binding protein [Chloroflexota bacterium]|jgi:ABC-type multidrug transport system fused ATPase/permease subunit